MTDRRTVYYLVHVITGERCFRVYETQSAARIAQRSRNRHVGFLERIERVSVGDNWEVEQCLVDGVIITATYAVVEGCVELLTEQLCE